MKFRNVVSELSNEMIPVFPGPKSVFARVILWSFLIFFILTFIRPFGISDDDFCALVISNIGFSIIVAVAVGIEYGIVRKYLAVRIGNHWQIMHEFYSAVGLLVIIALCNFFYSSLLLAHVSFSIAGALKSFVYTLLLLLPLAGTDLLLVLFTQYQKEVLTLQTKNRYLSDINVLHSLAPQQQNTMTLTLENEAVSFERNNVLAVSSWGNYLRFRIAVSSRVIEVVKRATMKELEAQLKPFPEFCRCHRSHIINLTQTERFAGTAKKASVYFASGALKIPVARSYTAKVREGLAADKNVQPIT